MRLDLGAGHTRRPGYLRVDADPTTEPDFLIDVRKLEPIATNSCDEIYVAHVLEHFEARETFSVLREWRRVLKSGGIITIKVPDVGWAARAWSFGQASWDEFHKAIFGGDPLATDFMRHKTAFYDKKLHRFLEITGFEKIEDLTKIGSGELTFRAVKP